MLQAISFTEQNICPDLIKSPIVSIWISRLCSHVVLLQQKMTLNEIDNEVIVNESIERILWKMQCRRLGVLYFLHRVITVYIYSNNCYDVSLNCCYRCSLKSWTPCTAINFCTWHSRHTTFTWLGINDVLINCLCCINCWNHGLLFVYL